MESKFKPSGSIAFSFMIYPRGQLKSKLAQGTGIPTLKSKFQIKSENKIDEFNEEHNYKANPNKLDNLLLNNEEVAFKLISQKIKKTSSVADLHSQFSTIQKRFPERGSG